jgi:hypothetical protein
LQVAPIVCFDFPQAGGQRRDIMSRYYQE